MQPNIGIIADVYAERLKCQDRDLGNAKSTPSQSKTRNVINYEIASLILDIANC